MSLGERSSLQNDNEENGHRSAPTSRRTSAGWSDPSISSTFECFMGPGVPRGRGQETWKGEVVGPETEEERRIRLTKEEAMLAHTPMEVFKSFYKRNTREIVKR